MSRTSLNVKNVALLEEHTKGRVVADLGAGQDARVSHVIKQRGALKVYAVDKDPVQRPDFHLITRRLALFHEWTPPPDCEVAFVGWPANNIPTVAGLIKLLPSFKKVIYVGKNTDGTACANLLWFETMLNFQVLDFVEDRLNTMIVYDTSAWLPARRQPCCEEEMAALQPDLIQYGALQAPVIP